MTNPELTEPDLELPPDMAAAYVTIDHGPRHEPALIDFSNEKLVVRRDDQPALELDTESVRATVGNMTMRLETDRQSVHLEFRTTAATKAADRGAQVALLGLVAAVATGVGTAATFAPAGKVYADVRQLRTLSDQRFPELYRYLERNAQSVGNSPWRSLQQAIYAPILIVFGLFFMVMLPALTVLLWGAFAAVTPFLIAGRGIWPNGFGAEDFVLVPVMTTISVGVSLVIASAIPWTWVVSLRLVHQAFASRARLVETSAYEMPLLARPYFRFKPAWLHVAMAVGIIAFAADDARREQDRIGFIIFSVLIVGSAVIAVVDAIRLTGIRRTTKIGWLDRYGAAENAFWHPSHRRSIAAIIVGSSILHLAVLAAIG